MNFGKFCHSSNYPFILVVKFKAINLFIIFLYCLFNIYRINSDVTSFISDVSNFCPLSIFLAWLDVYWFYWSFQRVSLCFHWYTFFISLMFALTLITFFCWLPLEFSSSSFLRCTFRCDLIYIFPIINVLCYRFSSKHWQPAHLVCYFYLV